MTCQSGQQLQQLHQNTGKRCLAEPSPSICHGQCCAALALVKNLEAFGPKHKTQIDTVGNVRRACAILLNCFHVSFHISARVSNRSWQQQQRCQHPAPASSRASEHEGSSVMECLLVQVWDLISRKCLANLSGKRGQSQSR